MSLRKNLGAVSQKYLGAKKTRALKTLLSINNEESTVTKPSAPEYNYGDNKVINHPRLDHAKITFKGSGNILYCETSDTIFSNCNISFEGDNALVYISKHSNKNRKYRIKIYAQSDTVVYVGENTNFHIGRDSLSYLMASEGKNIFIGNDCLFSLNTWFRTSDGHAAYDTHTKTRINHARSIFVGDHVWFGQDTTLLKGARIGSGSIVGAGSILTGKTFPSNASIAGVPAKILKVGVFFDKPNINGYSGDRIDEVEHCDTDEWIYSRDKSTLDFDTIDKAFSKAKTSTEKLVYIQKHLAGSKPKNRFYIGE